MLAIDTFDFIESDIEITQTSVDLLFDRPGAVLLAI